MKYSQKTEFIKKKSEGVPVLNFEGGPGVPILNFKGALGSTFRL